MFLEAGTGWAARVHFHPAWARRWKLRGSPEKGKLVFPLEAATDHSRESQERKQADTSHQEELEQMSAGVEGVVCFGGGVVFVFIYNKIDRGKVVFKAEKAAV